jgi:hypothetical protein
MAGKRGHPRAPYSTWKKTVWLSPECLDLIAAWRARQPGTTVSSAVETLVRLGLQQDVPTAYAAPLEAACRAAVKEEMARTTALLASASVDSHVAATLALRLAGEGQLPEQIEAMRRTVRQQARDTVRNRASRKGRAELAALLVEPEP